MSPVPTPLPIPSTTLPPSHSTTPLPTPRDETGSSYPSSLSSQTAESASSQDGEDAEDCVDADNLSSHSHDDQVNDVAMGSNDHDSDSFEAEKEAATQEVQVTEYHGQEDEDDGVMAEEYFHEFGNDEESGPISSYGDDRNSEDKRVVAKDILAMQDAIPELDDYPIVDKIGEGTFSSVFKAEDRYHDLYDNFVWTHTLPHPPWDNDGQPRSRKRVYVALKKINVTSSPDRIYNELEVMEELRHSPNIAYLITAFRKEDQIIAVMPYSRHQDFRHYYREISLGSLRNYFRCLFNALSATHAINVMHRDVKPANFLFNPETQQGVLCDFGLAERFDAQDWKGKCHHTCPTADAPRGTIVINTSVNSIHTAPGGALHPDTMNAARPAKKAMMGPPSQKSGPLGYKEHDKRSGVRANRAGTRGFRAPEVLLKCQDQTPAVDIWSAGIILLAFLTRRFPIFNANSDMEALIELMIIFGKPKIARAALLHNRTFNCTVPLDNPDGWRITDFIKHLNPSIMIPPADDPDPEAYAEEVEEALDLCRVCLHVDLTRRWTAEECLDHAFLRARGDEG